MLNWDNLDQQTNDVIQRRQIKKSAGQNELMMILPVLAMLMKGRSGGGMLMGGVSGIPGPTPPGTVGQPLTMPPNPGGKSPTNRLNSWISKRLLKGKL